MLKNIIQKVRLGAIYTAMCVGLVAVPLVATAAVSATPLSQAQSGVNGVGGSGGTTLPAFITSIINILLFLIGAIAVIMIIVGGIRYVTSNGEQASITGAKNTILYAVVGLVVAVMAYAIVNFVLTKL